MKKFVVSTLLFVLVPLVMSHFFLKLYMSANGENIDLYDFNYSWIEKLEHPPKVLLLGSSTIKYGLNSTILAEELGYEVGQVINLAENGRTAIQTAQLLKDSPEQTFDSVSVVVIGIDSWTYSQKYYEHNTLLMYDLNPIQSLLLRNGSEKEITFNEMIGVPLYKRILGSYKVSNTELEVPEFYGSGRLEKKPKNFDESVRNWYQSDVYSFSDIQFHHLKRILDFFKRKGIKVILLDTPKRSDWREDLEKNCAEVQREFDTRLKQIIGGQVHVIHTTSVRKEDESLFFNDGIHLNTIGQDWYSVEFAKVLSGTR